MLLRLLAIAVLALVLTLGSASASASDVTPEACPLGAISAIGPVDAQGRGDATPEVACLAP
jgi:hypothetical protein